MTHTHTHVPGQRLALLSQEHVPHLNRQVYLLLVQLLLDARNIRQQEVSVEPGHMTNYVYRWDLERNNDSHGQKKIYLYS